MKHLDWKSIDSAQNEGSFVNIETMGIFSIAASYPRPT